LGDSTADSNEAMNSKSTEESDRLDTDENFKLEVKEETVEDIITSWVGSIRKIVEGVILEKDKKLEEILDDYKKNKIEAKEKVDAKYKEIIPKPGRLPPTVLEAFLKKLKTNSENELNRLLSEVKEKKKVEDRELLKSSMTKINFNNQITGIATKAKGILKRDELQPKQMNGSLVVPSGDTSSRGRKGWKLKDKISHRSISPLIPEVETSAEILKSLNLRIYGEKLVSELENAAITARS